MSGQTDQELVALLKQCDAAAFNEVFERYRARLYGFLVRLSGRGDVAEDLLQETWIRLSTRVSDLRDDARLAPWLFAVARNLYRSYRRSRFLAARRLLEFFSMRTDAGMPVSPFEAVARDECERRIERALVALPLLYREALLLVAVEGITPSEAAAICDLDPATFRKRLSRARALVAAKLRELPHYPCAAEEPALRSGKRAKTRRMG